MNTCCPVFSCCCVDDMMYVLNNVHRFYYTSVSLCVYYGLSLGTDEQMYTCVWLEMDARSPVVSVLYGCQDV